MKQRKIISIFLVIIITSFFIQIEKVNWKNNKDIENTNTANYISKNNRTKKSNYMATIHIPKINLIKGLPYQNTHLNNVDKNIEVLKFDTDKTIVLAAHSGTSKVSFFKNIKNLTKEDIIYIHYKNNKYTYKVTKKYEVEKTGKIKIENSNEKRLVLTTCSSNRNKQLIIISILNRNY